MNTYWTPEKKWRHEESYKFLQCCVGWDPSDIHTPGGLTDLIRERRKVTRRTFLRHVDWTELREIERGLGYCHGMTMAQDCYVEYFRSTWHGRRVYGFRWSAVEHVFCKEK